MGKQCEWDGITYESIAAAAKAQGISNTGMKDKLRRRDNRAKRKQLGLAYEEKRPRNALRKLCLEYGIEKVSDLLNQIIAAEQAS